MASPAAVATGQRAPAPATSSGSGGTRPGGLAFAAARSMERSLSSMGSEGFSAGLEGGGGDDLTGVAQPSVELHQEHFVRYSGLSEGATTAACMTPTPAASAPA